MEFINTISVLGIGGIIGGYIKHLLDRNKEREAKLNQINEEKYRVLLIYMSFILNPQNRAHFITDDQLILNLKPEDSINYSKKKVEEYYYHSFLYASDAVLISLKRFIEKPSRENFIEVATEMRKHLWRNSSKLSIDNIILDLSQK